MARDASLARRGRAAAVERDGGALPKRPSALRLWLRRRRGLLRPAGLTLLGAGVLAAAGFALLAADPAGRIVALQDRAADIAAGAGITVRQVTLEGHRNAPLDLIREAVAVRHGDPLLAFDPHLARERLELIAWIEKAHVERHLNGTIRIRIEERRPFAIWQRDGRFSVVDRKGDVVTSENIGQFGRLPLLVGAGAAGQEGTEMIDLLHSLPEVADRTHALVRVSGRRWNLKLRSGADVLLPDGQEAAALRRLAELQAQQKLLDRPLAAIDLRLPDKLVIRLQGAPTEPAPAAQQQRARSGRG
jgi:cell division protein FtsQ